MDHEEKATHTPPTSQPETGSSATPPATFEAVLPSTLTPSDHTTTMAKEAGTIATSPSPPKCNCAEHEHDESALQWHCPEHGSRARPAPVSGDTRTTVGRTYMDDVALQRALDHMGIKVRYEERRQRPQLTDNSGDWQDFDTPGLTALRFTIGRAFTYTAGKDDKAAEKRLYYGRDSFRDALLALADARRVDSFTEWLEQLPAWDGTHRASRWIADLFQPGGPSALTRWAALSIPLAAIWRTYEPGTKHDECVVLIGPQGCGKSTAFRKLLPGETMDQRDWFNDALELATDNKRRAEALLGRVIVEASELAGSTRADVESLKAFLSRIDDGGVRLAYRRDPQRLPRRCVIVGSTNDPRPLPNDPSGNRRFIPLTCTSGNPVAIRQYMDRHRVQIWAEGLHRYRAGEVAWIPEHLQPPAREAASAAQHADDLLEDKLDEYLHTAPEAFRLVDAVRSVLGMTDPPPRDKDRILRALRKCGATVHRDRQFPGVSTVIRYWRKPA